MNTSLPDNLVTTKVSKTGFAFILVTSLFFLWGFSNNLNPILIPHLKKSFTLTTTQSTLVDSAVYIAYFLMALPAGYVMNRFGYKIGIITGLLFFSIGSFLFIPAANTQSYDFFLFALFVIACGLGFLETAANPYAAALGRPETSTQRLNLAQSFNGLGGVMSTYIGARVILVKGHTDQQLNTMTAAVRKIALASEASSVKTPYFILGSVLLLIAFAFLLTKLPEIQHKAAATKKSQTIFHALRSKHLKWAVIAQFFYVGAQVCVLSLFVLYATKSAGIDDVKAAYYLGGCFIMFLAGRFIGTFLMRYIKPNHLLAIYAVINTFLCIAAITMHGMITVYIVMLISFFMSVMFPTIFALGIADLGGDTEYGSSLLIMSIVGGAVLPRVFGLISDSTGNIQLGYMVPLICFVVIGYFGWKGYKTDAIVDINMKEEPLGRQAYMIQNEVGE
jgi:FHS family L-fucose permease-like MFS transporter